MEHKGEKALKIRISIFPNVPPFVQFENPAHLVTEKLESLKPQSGDDNPSHVWHMWLPHINQTVVRAVEQAGFQVSRISSRDYRNIKGGLWDYADGEEEEEDFQNLSYMVSTFCSEVHGSVDHISFKVKINRFPGSHTICRKDQLVLN